jgi:hypothetical protein
LPRGRRKPGRLSFWTLRPPSAGYGQGTDKNITSDQSTTKHAMWTRKLSPVSSAWPADALESRIARANFRHGPSRFASEPTKLVIGHNI